MLHTDTLIRKQYYSTSPIVILILPVLLLRIRAHYRFHDDALYKSTFYLLTTVLLLLIIMIVTFINSTQYLPIRESISTTVQHQMSRCQRGLSLFKRPPWLYNHRHRVTENADVFTDNFKTFFGDFCIAIFRMLWLRDYNIVTFGRKYDKTALPEWYF